MMYLLERQYKEEGLFPGQIVERQKQEVAPIPEKLYKWQINEYRPNLKNPFTKAVKYTLKRWKKLIIFLQDS